MSERHLFQRGMLRCECGEAMLPRSARDSADVYVCRAHKLDSTPCAMPPLRRDTIDEVALAMFEDIALDVEATGDHVVQHLDAGVRETRARLDRVAREVIELAAQADRLDLATTARARCSTDDIGDVTLHAVRSWDHVAVGFDVENTVSGSGVPL